MGWFINTIKNKLGCSTNLFTVFELELMRHIAMHLSPEMQKILEDQVSHFNLVQRTPNRDDIVGRETRFYWIRFGKVCLDYPLKFPVKEEEFLMAELTVKHELGATKVKFFIVRQIFFMIEVESDEKAYFPKYNYEIRSLKVFL
jgi:hypothetical protein